MVKMPRFTLRELLIAATEISVGVGVIALGFKLKHGHDPVWSTGTSWWLSRWRGSDNWLRRGHSFQKIVESGDRSWGNRRNYDRNHIDVSSPCRPLNFARSVQEGTEP
jgi:hypothetical protein